MKKIKMLPHVWQKVGIVFLIISLLVSVICYKAVCWELFLSKTLYSPDSFGFLYGYILFFFSFIVGVVFIAIAKEKDEDERVSAIRQQAVLRTVIIYLITAALFVFIDPVIRMYCGMDRATRISHIKDVLTSVPAFILYYILIFKLSLWLDNKKVDNEE